MNKALRMSLTPKKLEKQVAKVEKLPMKKEQPTNLIPKKQLKLDGKAAKRGEVMHLKNAIPHPAREEKLMEITSMMMMTIVLHQALAVIDHRDSMQTANDSSKNEQPRCK